MTESRRSLDEASGTASERDLTFLSSNLTRTIAREYGPQGIRANSICPAMIETAMLDGLSEE
jgi:Enoyl-(Acyl carrier protein) reductase